MGIFSIVLISLNDNKLGSSILLGKKIRFRFLLFFINFYQQITIIIQIIITFLLTSLSLSLSLSLSTYTHIWTNHNKREIFNCTKIYNKVSLLFFIFLLIIIIIIMSIWIHCFRKSHIYSTLYLIMNFFFFFG